MMDVKKLICYLTLHRYFQKQICVPKKEYLSGDRCEGTNVAVKCRIFVTSDLIGINIVIDTHACNFSEVICINKEEQIWLPNKE